MSTKPSSDTILRAFESLRPEAEQLEQEWDAARRGHVLKAVLSQTADRPPRRWPAARWLGAGIAAAAALAVVAMLAVPHLMPSPPVVPAEPAPPTSTPEPTATATAGESDDATLRPGYLVESPIEMPFDPYVDLAREAAQADIDAWFAATREPFAAQQKQIAQCMADADFDYRARTLPDFPVEWTVLGSMPGSELELPWLPASREQVARLGYANPPDSHAADPRYPDNAYAETVSWSRGGVPIDQWHPEERANNATFEALSKAEQGEFMTALQICTGDRELRAKHPDVPTKHALASRAAYLADEYPGSDGALDWLYDYWEIFQAPFVIHRGPGFLGPKRFEQPIQDHLDVEAIEAAGGIYADPEVIELNTAWTTCMRSAGVVPETADLAGLNRLGPNSFQVLQWAVPAKGQFDEGSYREIALADFDCRARTDYVNTFAQRQAALETKVVAAHQGELDATVHTWENRRNR